MTQEFQQSALASFCSAVDGVQELLVSALDAVESSLNIIAGHVRHDGLAKLGSLTTHSANCEARESQARVTSNDESASHGTTP